MAKVLGVKDGSLAATIELKQHGSVSVPQKTFAIIYIVLSASPVETEDDIIDAPGIPPRWYPINGAVCVAHDANQIQTVRNPVTGAICDIWEVTAYFDTRAIPDDCGDSILCKRPKIRWYGETEDEVMVYDEDGQPVVTDAGEAIIITKPYTIAVLEIQRYENAPFDPDVILAYGNHTNATTFWGAPPGSALMVPPESEEEVINNVVYANTTYTIKFKIRDLTIVADLLDIPVLEANENSWHYVALHQGYMFRPAPDRPPQIAQDKQGQPITVNLARGGTKLPPGDVANYKYFKRHPRVDFNNLSLGPF